MTTASDKPLDIDIIGRYKVLKVLGSGAMGVVYQAVDPVIERVVAIKTVNFQINQSDIAEYEARFAQEIKAAGKLNHPNIVTIFDVGKTDRFAYMAMEFIEGEELKALVAPDKPLPIAIATSIAAQVADGLAFAHSREIIHRDVKPSNIMVSEAEGQDGLVAKIMDFGIARMPASKVKTLTGMILGSPRYMSPEQVIGTEVTAATDVFSLGVVLYEMLTGYCPFDGPNISAIMYATVNTPPPPPSAHNPLVPENLDALVLQALAKEPAARFATMRDFARAMHEAVKHIGIGDWPPVPEFRRVKLPPKPAPTTKPEAATIRVKTDTSIANAAAAKAAAAAAPAGDAPSANAPAADQAPDSTLARLRLAQYIQQRQESERLALGASAAKTDPAPAAPIVELPPQPTQRPGISLDGTLISTRGANTPRETLPTGPLLLLGGLAVLVVALGIALIVV
ncbi:MAG: serine/threonine-protein kinase [Burkholderiales bacterium]|nr:serine/threonine-protein kinase [Burkholderiales bacterium]